jgi:hypothetical protein
MNMKQYQYSTPVLLILLLLIAACTQEGERNAALQTAVPEVAAVGTQNPDPCTLLSKAEIEEVLGQEVADPQPNPGNAAICEFNLDDHGAVSFTVQRLDPDATLHKMIAELKKRNIPVSEVSGIGDHSFFASHGYGMIQLNTFKDQRYIILTLLIPGATEDTQKAAAGELMRKMLSKL